MKLIEPRTLKGFRDYLPEEQIARTKMIKTITDTYELFGFEPLETPVLEYEDVLAGKYGDEGEQLMYRFKDHGDRNVALRYDLTVPLARVVAQYQGKLPMPFKRYQASPVWRAENTQKGRFREFIQCDADVIGAEAGIADAECIAVIEASLFSLGIDKFIIKVNNRKLLNAIMRFAGVPEDKLIDAIRAIDKIEKIGSDGVIEELKKTVGMTEPKAKELIKLSVVTTPNIKSLKSLLNKNILKDPQGVEGLAELNAVFDALKGMSVKNVEIDLSLARGLDYYTSTVYETYITENAVSKSFGSIASGGRYDSLIKLFIGKDIPAVGVSFGVDRLFAAMQELGHIEKSGVTQLLILNLDETLQDDYLSMATDLRSIGINTEVYYKTADFKKQYAFAESKSIPFALIFGANEKQKDIVALRNLADRKQSEIKKDAIISELKKFLK